MANKYKFVKKYSLFTLRQPYSLYQLIGFLGVKE